jgi:hypothetical protein
MRHLVEVRNASRTVRLLETVLGLALVVTLAVCPVHAQFSGAIQGIVTDPSGAVVPAVTITLTNVNTGVTQTAETNATGSYYFPNLPPGKYKVEAKATGFQSIVQENVALTAGAVQGVPFRFKVASAEEQVQVIDTPPLVQTDQPSVAGIIDEQQIQELPLQGRNFINLMAQAPGVVGQGAMGNPGLDIFANDQLPAVLSNGQPASANTNYLDGSFLSDSASLGFVKVVPNPDSISEVVISTTDYSAQFGLGGGTIAQLVSRSGTNQFHGSLFEYHQDNKLTARTEFQNVKDPITGRFLPVFRRNEFGGSFGGPIRKDKTFFFFSYDQVRGTRANAFLTTVETPQFVSFMQSNFPNNLSTSLLAKYHPSVGPLSNIQTVSSLSPGCSGTGPLGMPCNLALLGTGAHSFITPEKGLQWNFRIDQNFSSGDKIYGNFYYTPTSGISDTVRPAFIQHSTNNAYYGAVNWVHVFSPTIVFMSGFGGTHQSFKSDCPECQVPGIGVSGMNGFSNGFIAQNGFANADTHWREVLSLSHGRHSLKVGFEMFHDQNFAKFTPAAAHGSYSFLNVFDFASDKPDFQSITFDPTTGGVANEERYWLRSDYATYVQDNWKVKPNLSLDMGLRWEFPSNPSEAQGNRSNLVLGSGTTLQQQIASAFVRKSTNAFSEEKRDYFAPRLGIAWQPSWMKDLSIRAGGGIYYNRGGDTIWSDTAFANPPIAASLTATPFVPSGPQPVYGLCQSSHFPFNCPTPPLPVGLNAAGGSIAGKADVGGPDLKLLQAYAENWFFGVQRSFGRNWTVEADYLGSNGVHLYSITNLNRFAGDRTLHNGNITRLNPFFGAINFADNGNHSSYNGGDLAVKYRFSHGFNFQAAYTFGKAIDLVGGAPGCNRCSENDQVVDAYNIQAQRGLSEGDISRQLAFNGLWDIPTPSDWAGVKKGFLGGWQFSTVAVLHAGTPQSVFSSSADYNGDGNFYDYPNTPAFGKTKTGLSRSDYLKGVFAKSDFPSPCPPSGPSYCGVEGNLGRDTFRGPGFAQVDTAFSKSNHIPWFVHEGAQLQFRAEMFNAFNRVNLTGWDTNLSDGTFGKATSTYQARTVQLSLRIAF